MGASVGLRELRQHASDVLRRVEAGEHVTVTVSGREVAELSPVVDRVWRRADEIAVVWEGGSYGDLERDEFDDDLRDPFAQDGR